MSKLTDAKRTYSLVSCNARADNSLGVYMYYRWEVEMIGQKILLVLHLSIIQRGILATMTALMDGNEKSETHLYKNLAPSFVLRPLKGTAGLAWIIHEGLLRQPMLSPGGAFLVRSPRRTASTSASASLVRSPWERARLGAPGVGGEMEASVSARHGRLTTRRRPQT